MAREEHREKPYPGFPLSWHSSGYWFKRIAGKFYYFGTRYGSHEEALEDYLMRRDHPDRQEVTRGPQAALTVNELCDAFMESKERQMNAGELTQRSFNDYFRLGVLLLKKLGKGRLVEAMEPDDFGILKLRLTEGVSVQTAANRIRLARIIFRFAEQDGLIQGRVKFGSQFKITGRKLIRRERQANQQKHGIRMFEPGQVHDLMRAANAQWRAMILLGINCGYGNTDLSEIRAGHISGEWATYPRQKTSVDRVAWLWPETREALQEHGAIGDDGRLFCRRTGGHWVKVSAKCVDDGIAKQFSKMMAAVGHKRPGLTFYSLRHTFQTVADGAKDPLATALVMGHVDETMSGRYRERFERDRVRAVCEFVRAWYLAGS